MIIRVCLDEGSEEQSGFRVVMASGEQTADAGPGHLSVVVLPRDARTFMFPWALNPHSYTLSRQKERCLRRPDPRTVAAGDAVSKCPQEPRPFSWGHLLEFPEGSCHMKVGRGGLPEATGSN